MGGVDELVDRTLIHRLEAMPQRGHQAIGHIAEPGDLGIVVSNLRSHSLDAEGALIPVEADRQAGFGTDSLNLKLEEIESGESFSASRYTPALSL
jgi:hypothetical protein